MEKHLFLLLSILLSINGFSQDWVGLGMNQPTAPTAVLLSQTDDEINVKFNLVGYNTIKVSTPRGKADIINVPKMASMLVKGAPDMPLFAIPVAIGDQDEMQVAVVAMQYKDFQNIEIAPSKGNLSREINPDDVSYTYGDAYFSDEFYPSQQAVLDYPYILRDVRGQNVLVYPFAYNPVKKVLRVYTEMTLKLQKISEKGENPKMTGKRSSRLSAETEAMYARRFVNYHASAAKYPFVPDQGETMVICADVYLEAMQPYVDWKNQSGRPTTLYSLTEVGGNNCTAIKDFIHSHYNNPSENLCFVLLVGDYADLTPRSINGGCSDIWYGQLEGNDNYPEILVGRFSAESVAHVERQVAKVIYYERDMPADADWLAKGIGIGSTEGQSSGHNGGEADYQHIDYIRDTLLHYTYSEVSQHYAGVGVGTNAAMLSENFNAGAGICNYCNHGTTTGWSVGSFNSNHVNALVNDYKWPFIWSTACLNGKFDVNCFAEVWMRATDNTTGVPTGAIGGMFSWINQPWQPPMTGQDEMVDILCEWRSADRYHHTLGGASLNGNMKILDLHPSDQGNTHNTWILFGDPNLMLRTATPELMHVSCQQDVIFLGQSALHIAVDADYALATLSKDGNVLCSTPIVDGEATLVFEGPTEVGTVQLVVVGFNKVTHIQDLEIIPSDGAFLAYNNLEINSESGQADYGQTFTIDLTVKNMGNGSASNVQATLTSDSPFVEILDGEAFISNIAAMEELTIEEGFQIKVADLIEDGTKAEFVLNCSDGTNEWISRFRMTLHAPVFALADFRPTANVNPGQNGSLMVSIRNIGSAASHNTRLELYSSSTDIALDETAQWLWNIPAGATATAQFPFTADANILLGSSYEMMYIVEAEQYMLEGTEFLNVGPLKETFETGDFSAFDWQTLGGSHWFVDNSTANTGTYSARSGAIANANVTTLQIQVEVTEAGQISFYKKICTEADKDKLTFYMDSQTLGVWSGEIGWSQESFDVTAGTHTFKWIYMKDSSGSYSDDACWIDDIQFPAAEVIEMPHGPELQAAVDRNQVMLSWENLGTGYEYIIRCNGTVLSTQTGTTFTETRGDGIYLYSVVAQRDYTLTAPSYALVEVGILNVVELENEVMVYPNPTQGIVNIETIHGKSLPNAEYRVFNLMGQQVFYGRMLRSAQIDFTGQARGIYVLHIVCKGQTMTQKIVVR